METQSSGRTLGPHNQGFSFLSFSFGFLFLFKFSFHISLERSTK